MWVGSWPAEGWIDFQSAAPCHLAPESEFWLSTPVSDDYRNTQEITNMNENEFWTLIASSREGTDECEEQASKLAHLLSGRPTEEIQSFDEIFAAKRQEAYRWDLWGAAYLINGGCSDDGFEYFRCWLIGQGREVFENALKNPDSLADVLTGDEEDLECEDLLYAADEAYEDLVGEPMPPREFKGDSTPQGTEWDEDDLAGMFPRLAAMFP